MAYRVAVWGTGNIGRSALRTIVSNPNLELAGVIVSAKEKIGKDAGELCNLPPTGVIATNDASALFDEGRIDAVAYCASGDFRPSEALDELEGCLRAGANVVSTAAYPLYDPKSAPDAIRERFEAACEAGSSSLFVSGVDPGFINDIVPLLLSGLCEEINEIRSREIFNYATYYAPEAVRNLVGFGMPMGTTPPMVMPSIPTSIWGGMIRFLARTLDVELDSIEEVVERRPLEETVTVPIGVFEKGTQGAMRFEIQGIVGGEPKIIVEHVTRIIDDIAPDWPTAPQKGAHSVHIIGKPNIQLVIEPTDTDGNSVGGGNATAAARIVNAIPAVCEAHVGLLDSIDIPAQPGRGLLR
jgi:hypothetical protein